jgi:F0F1-type ATP synthase gamma subunit
LHVHGYRDTIATPFDMNAARLKAMESARDNVTRKLDSLREERRRARQSEITAEVLELATAAKALGARGY